MGLLESRPHREVSWHPISIYSCKVKSGASMKHPTILSWANSTQVCYSGDFLVNFHGVLCLASWKRSAYSCNCSGGRALNICFRADTERLGANAELQLEEMCVLGFSPPVLTATQLFSISPQLSEALLQSPHLLGSSWPQASPRIPEWCICKILVGS